MHNRIAFVSLTEFNHNSRLQKQIRSLRKQGYEITLFSGNIKNEPSFAERFNISIVKKPIKYNKIKLNSFIQVMMFCVKVSRLLIKQRFDAIVCCALGTLLAGVLTKRKVFNTYLVFDSKELAVERYRGIKKILWNLIQKLSLLYCDIIIQAEENRLEYFKKLHNIPDEKMVLIQNFPLKEETDFELKNPEKFINIIYLGVIMPGRGYIKLIKAFSQMNDKIKLDIVGFGGKRFVNEVKKEIREHNIKNVQLLPPVPRNEISLLLKNYHIGLFFYENINLNNYYCAPNKFYDYFHNGLAVISYRYPGLIDLIEGNKIGVCISEINSEELKSAINTIVSNNYFANITYNLRENFTWEIQEERYLSIFSKNISDL